MLIYDSRKLIIPNMKTSLIVSLFFFLAPTGILLAQTDLSYVLSEEAEPYPWEYCQIVGVSKLFNNNVVVSIDYGQKRKLMTDTGIRNAEGKLIEFESMIDAMNYLAQYGWEFVNAYVVSAGNQHVYHYMLKRPIPGATEGK